MYRNDEGGIMLTATERQVLALYLAAHHLVDAYRGVEWEDIPNLAEDEWRLLDEEMGRLAVRLRARAVAIDPRINASDIIKELQA